MEAQAGGWQAEVACARLNSGLGAEGAPLAFGFPWELIKEQMGLFGL